MIGFVPLESPLRLEAEQPPEHELGAWRIIDLTAGRRPTDRRTRGFCSFSSGLLTVFLKNEVTPKCSLSGLSPNIYNCK